MLFNIFTSVLMSDMKAPAMAMNDKPMLFWYVDLHVDESILQLARKP